VLVEDDVVVTEDDMLEVVVDVTELLMVADDVDTVA
jgi:hypothetical protein